MRAFILPRSAKQCHGGLAAALAAGGLVAGCGLFKTAPEATPASPPPSPSAAPATENPAFFRGFFSRPATPVTPTPENPAFFKGLSARPKTARAPAETPPDAAPASTAVVPSAVEAPSLFPSLASDTTELVVPPADKLQAVLDKTPWDYAPNALTVDVDSDPAINTFANEPHSLVLAVVQAADAGAFHQLLATPAQFSQVLQGAPPANGLLAVDRYAIEPGQQVRIVADRMQGARFVGFVAAYYGVSPAATSRLFAVPVRFTSTGLILKDYRAAPVPALLRLKLGPAVILSATLEPVAADPTVPGAGAVASPTTAGAIPLAAPGGLQGLP